MTSVSKHLLRIGLSTFGGYHAEGWHPTLSTVLVGPTPAAARLEWRVVRPDGVVWFEQRMPAPLLGAREAATLDLRPTEDVGDLDSEGVIGFTLRLVSELDGVDELLHDGSARVVALPGEHRFAVDHDGLLPRGFLALDTPDEPDAPRLWVTAFVPGDAEAWEFEAHLVRDGRRVAQADSSDTRHAFTANDGEVVGRELAFRFDAVRGWNNLRDSGWGGDWLLLDESDGHFEVKLVRETAVAHVLSFDVVHGRIVARGLVEADPSYGAVIEVEASLPAGVARGDGISSFYGDAANAVGPLTLDDLYAVRVAADPDPQPEPSTDADTESAPGGTPGGGLDATAGAALRAYFDRAERLLLTWEADMIETRPPFEFAQVLTAEAVLAERPGYETLCDAASVIPDDHPVELAGEATTIGGLRVRVDAMFAAAEARISGAQQETSDALAPYRALLSGDKLAVFEEHPADAFLYTTTDRRVIETPEEIAAAEYWYFEGPADLPSTATVDGVQIKVTVQGWRVLGWRFAADHSIVEEFETQGHGSSAPKSAFRPQG